MQEVSETGGGISGGQYFSESRQVSLGNGEYGFKEFWRTAVYISSDDFRAYEDAGVDFSDLPKVQGVLEFHKNGTWEFYIEKESAMEGNRGFVDDILGDSDDEDAVEACEEYLEALNDELDDLLEVFEWSGDYELDEKEGEIGRAHV